MKRAIIIFALLAVRVTLAQDGAVWLNVMGQRSWSPLHVAGCEFWLDPSNAGYLTLDGTNIVSMVDRAGMGDWGQTNEAVRPFYDGSLINGLPAIRTSAPGRFMFSSSTHTVSDVFIVTRTTTYSFLGGIYGAQFRDLGLRLASSGTWNNAAGQDFAFGGVIRINGVETNRYPTASAYLITARASAPKTDFQSGIGWYATPYPTRYYVGLIGEVIGYSSPVSDEDRALIESYLMTKWGL